MTLALAALHWPEAILGGTCVHTFSFQYVSWSHDIPPGPKYLQKTLVQYVYTTSLLQIGGGAVYLGTWTH